MAFVIIVAAVVGFAILFVTTTALVLLNWSEKTLAPVLSILLVGTATTLAAVLVTLKGSAIESAFATPVVMDTTDGAPLFTPLDPNNVELTSRLNDLAMLGRPTVQRDGKPVRTIEKPANQGEMFTFGGELLQYQLLQIIRSLQRGGWKAGITFGVSTATVSKPMRLSNVEDYPKQALLSAISSNRFSRSDREQSLWEHIQIPLPKNTSMSFDHIASSPSTGTEKHILRLEKPMFFQIDLVVEPIAGTGFGPLPKGLTLAPDVAARCQTYQYQITMQAKFEWITAGNSQTQEYKDWATWLFSGVKGKLGD